MSNDTWEILTCTQENPNHWYICSPTGNPEQSRHKDKRFRTIFKNGRGDWRCSACHTSDYRPRRLPRVYIAAPYNGGSTSLVARAIRFGDTLSLLGYVPFIPHLNHFWDLMHPHSSSFWRKWDNEWLSCCDVLIRLSGESDGADAEVELAKTLNIPVVYDLLELAVWQRNIWEKVND